MPATTMWRNRIVRHGEAPASSFLANEANWRIHPTEQQSALRRLIGHDLGWLQGVIVNLRTSRSWGPSRNVETLIDGHARVNEALRAGDETLVPVTYVDLTPREERLALATYDPVGELTVTDEPKFVELATSLGDLDEDLTAVVRSVLGQERKVARGLRHEVKPCTCCGRTCDPNCGCYRPAETDEQPGDRRTRRARQERA